MDSNPSYQAESPAESKELIVQVGKVQHRDPDPTFVRRLREFDPTLYVGWNAWKQRWCIEQCVRHLASTKDHSHICRKVYVWLVQDPEGYYMGLGEHVIDKLRSMDTRRKYGEGEEGLKNWERARQAENEAHKQREQKEARELVQNAVKDNRVQLNEAVMLLDRHDLRVNQ